MLDDRSAIEHHKYSQRLTELERRSAAAQQRQQKKQTRTLNIKNLPPPLNQNIINCPSIGDRKDYPGAIEANCTARER